MKLRELNKIAAGIKELQNCEIDTVLSYRLASIQNAIMPHLQPMVEVLQNLIEDNKSAESAEKIVRAEEKKLLDEDIDINLPKIKLSDLPKNIKGSIAAQLFAVIEDDTADIVDTGAD